MKAVHIEKPGTIALVNMPVPKPKTGEALLKIKYCGICGSDAATFTGNQPFTTYPRIPGHEFSAEIVEIGANDRDLKQGMLVTAVPYFNCGVCYACRRGRTNCCEQNETMGVQRDGSFAEYIVMPVNKIVDGKGLPADILALIEPFSISRHAVTRGRIQKGDNVLVIGAGPIGMFAMLAAKEKGARVYIADLVEGRLELAKRLGADGTINTGKEDMSASVKEITAGGGMDVCIEAAGLPQTFLACIEQACFGGQIILIGNGKKETTFNHSLLLKKELDVFGSRNSRNDFEPLIELVARGAVDIKPLITDVFPFTSVIEAFRKVTANDGTSAKVLVSFEG
ncbi:MAG: zinc-binding alcohol dehydrogenase family protein [Spirochaetes bacterium]|nr:zinc-binding alcohol dehydrogenase family protein [Spirochaetota bacterium]